MPLNIYRCPASDHEKCSYVSQSEIQVKTVVLRFLVVTSVNLAAEF